MSKKKTVEKTGLEKAIEDLFLDMSGRDGDSEEYARMVEQMNTLYKLKEVDNNKTSVKREWAKIIIPAAGSFLGILAIVGHERTSVITSQGMKFIQQFK